PFPFLAPASGAAVTAGFVSAGFVSGGFVSAGFVSGGFASGGDFASAGFVSGVATATGVVVVPPREPTTAAGAIRRTTTRPRNAHRSGRPFFFAAGTGAFAATGAVGPYGVTAPPAGVGGAAAGAASPMSGSVARSASASSRAVPYRCAGSRAIAFSTTCAHRPGTLGAPCDTGLGPPPSLF